MPIFYIFSSAECCVRYSVVLSRSSVRLILKVMWFTWFGDLGSILASKATQLKPESSRIACRDQIHVPRMQTFLQIQMLKELSTAICKKPLGSFWNLRIVLN